MLKLVKRVDTWWISGTIGGVRVRESTGTHSRRHAEAVLTKRQQEILDRHVFGEQVTATWAEAVNLYLDLGGEARYLEPLTERWGLLRLAAITPLELARVARDVYPGAAASTLDRQLYTPAIAVLNAAAEAGLCPVPKFRRPKVKRELVEAPDDGWIVALLQSVQLPGVWRPNSPAAIRRAAACRRVTALVLLMTLTGARISEAVNLKRRHVNLDTADALLASTKNGDPRRFDLAHDLVAALRALPDDGPDSAVLGYASRWTAAQAIERAAIAAKLPHYSPHQIGRHAFAQRMLADGHTLKAVQEAGGWKDIAIVARHYGHLERSAVAEAMRSSGTKLTQRLTEAQSNVIKFKDKKS
jgi:integrase